MSVRHDRVFRQGEAHDLVVLFGIKRAVVIIDAGSTGGALRGAVAEALDDVCVARPLAVLQREEEATCRRLVVIVIHAAPGVDVEHAVRRDDHLARVAELVGKYRRAPSGREFQAAVIAGTGIRCGRRCAGKRKSGAKHQSRGRQGTFQHRKLLIASVKRKRGFRLKASGSSPAQAGREVLAWVRACRTDAGAGLPKPRPLRRATSRSSGH